MRSIRTFPSKEIGEAMEQVKQELLRDPNLRFQARQRVTTRGYGDNKLRSEDLGRRERIVDQSLKDLVEEVIQTHPEYVLKHLQRSTHKRMQQVAQTAAESLETGT